MKPVEFVAKWSKIQQKERATAQTHFNDVCALVGHLTPLEYDPGGRDFSFETQAEKPEGEKGYADVFFRGKFVWEYKGPHKDLTRAYRQLQLYREALDNPPLLITSDLHTIEIHTNFTNRPVVRTTVTLDDIGAGPGVEVLWRVFNDPDSFRPERTREAITKASAESFLAVAEQMKRHQRLTGETYTPEELAHFLVRLLFCLFAEDLGLLPDKVFTQAVRRQGGDYADLRPVLANLFRAMRDGGAFGFHRIRHFNGTLFDDELVPTIPHDLAKVLLRAAEQDWSAVDPSIFGTIFERVIDPDKRAQLGAHYTSAADIMLIVEPVLMEPLRRKWDEVRREIQDTRYEVRDTSEEGDSSDSYFVGRQESPRISYLLNDFSNEIAAIRVLDPACGSGNFLYLALRELLNLQKEVIAYAARRGLPEIPLTVSPEQLYGIEINPYAHELAQITAWIGYLQWRHENGFAEPEEPILRPLNNIRRMDAILAYDEAGNPVEPEWLAAEVIIGNPPFLGNYKMRSELGDKYTIDLYRLYEGRIPNKSDLVCYWFLKASDAINSNNAKRIGLIATNSIRGGANRFVLDIIKNGGDIFLAWSDNPWILDGASVRVSIVGFDNGKQPNKTLDGNSVLSINSDLTSLIDLSKAQRLPENGNISYEGIKPAGNFVVDESIARLWMEQNSDNRKVLRPYVNARDLTSISRDAWLIDFFNMDSLEASKYAGPYDFIINNVKPERDLNRDKGSRTYWWLHQRSRSEMRKGIARLSRYICTPRHSKHRIFVWFETHVLADSAITVILSDDDYFFGVLHARPHELWSLRLGTWLGKGNDPRYTPTTTFETFPFPWSPGQEPSRRSDRNRVFAKNPVSTKASTDDELALEEAIARHARALVAWRDEWLNPPPPAKGTLDVAYDRLIKTRTLTNLYNGLVYYRSYRGPAFDRVEFDKQTRKSVTPAEIQELDDIHRALDAAVAQAYGWVRADGRPEDLSDEQILERLLALNKERYERS
ncbi:MAG: type IIL restriction-modification enzyme MmeI [Chloroflexota bacterium]